MAVANNSEDEIPVGLYLLRRIRELGCKTVQGLPGTFPPCHYGVLGTNGCWVGDFNLAFLDLIKSVDGLKWSGNCNELNAAYSADGTLNVPSRYTNGDRILTRNKHDRMYRHYIWVSSHSTCGVGQSGLMGRVGELSAAAGVAGSFCEYVCFPRGLRQGC
jgi:hypothetical protein